MDVLDIAIAKKHANSLSSGISNSTYDPSTATMTVNLNDGSSYDVKFDDGITTQDRETLDNVIYDSDTNTLLVDGKEVLLAEPNDPEDIDFSGMF